MRTFSAVIVALALPLTACQPVEPQSASEPISASAEADAPAPMALEGEYRVAAIDGQEVTGGIGLALTITDRQMWFEPRCAGFSWIYTYEDGALFTDRPQKPRVVDGKLVPKRGAMSAAVCRIAVHPEQQRLAKALDGVSGARVTPSNGLELTGEAHSVTLFTQ